MLSIQKKKMKNEWDDYAKDWEKNGSVIEYSKLAFKSLQNEVNIDELNILDFGCGTGALTELLLPRAKSIVALDSSPEMIRVLKNKKLSIGLIDEALTSDLVEPNPLLSSKFDLIVASSVCAFLPNYQQTLKLLTSLLHHKGKFVQWDWLAESDNAETGFKPHTVESAFKDVPLEISKLSIPFSINDKNTPMPVLMAIGIRP